MAPVKIDPEKVLAFADPQAFETWLSANWDKQDELWLRLYKKGSNVQTITYAQALDIALCWGWVDSIKKSYDEASFVQRFSPRKAKSIWSQVNHDHVGRLIASGRMQPAGLAHVEAAKQDGRWDSAYAPASKMEIPQDLLAAIQADPKALETFRTLNKQNLFALAFRLGKIKGAETRNKKIASFVEMLSRGEAIYPQGKGAGP